MLSYKNRKYFCPVCGERVILRVGPKTIPHFAHQKNQACYTSETESLPHLLGKLQLYQFLKAQKVQHLELEKYFPSFKQRADLFFVYDNQKIIIEFQCSPISLECFRKRTDNYRRNGIVCLWIFHDSLIHYQNQYQWRIPALVQWGISENKQLFFYNPTTEKFRILSCLTPYSKSIYFAMATESSLAQFQLYHLFRPPIFLPSFYQSWQKKRSFHLCRSPRFEGLKLPFFRRLYENGYSTSSLPFFVTIPLPHSLLLRTSSLEWQGYLFLEFLQYTTISLKQIKIIFLEKIKKKEIELAQLPNWRKKNPDQVLDEYILTLIFSGFFEKISDQLFHIHVNPNIISEQQLYLFLQKLNKAIET